MDITRLEAAWAEARRRVGHAARHRWRRGSDAELLAALDEQAKAGRTLAAAQGDEYAVPFEIGVRWSGGAPLPHLLGSGHRSFVAFYLEEPDPHWDGTTIRIVDPTDEEAAAIALAEFTSCRAVKLGPPNDEVYTAIRYMSVDWRVTAPTRSRTRAGSPN